MMRRALIAAALLAVLALIGLAARDALQRPAERFNYEQPPEWHERLWFGAMRPSHSYHEIYVGSSLVHDQDGDGLPDVAEIASLAGKGVSQTRVYSTRTGKEILCLDNADEREAWVNGECVVIGDRHDESGRCLRPDLCTRSPDESVAQIRREQDLVEVDGRRYRLFLPRQGSDEVAIRDEETEEFLFEKRLVANRETGELPGTWGRIVSSDDWVQRGILAFWSPGEKLRVLRFHPTIEFVQYDLPEHIEIGTCDGWLFAEERDDAILIYGDRHDEETGRNQFVQIRLGEDLVPEVTAFDSTWSAPYGSLPRAGPIVDRHEGRLVAFRMIYDAEVHFESLFLGAEGLSRTTLPSTELPVPPGYLLRSWLIPDQDGDAVDDFLVEGQLFFGAVWYAVSGATGAILPRPEEVE